MSELTFLVGMAFQLLLGEFSRRLAEHGYADLRPIHGMAFQALRGDGLTSTELAARLGVTKQAAGQLVTDLERRGYLRRERHPDGGRRRLVVLTDQAHEHLQIAGQVLHQLEAELDPAPEMRAELQRLINQLGGETPPPLRPVW